MFFVHGRLPWCASIKLALFAAFINHHAMLNLNNTLLVIVDVQGKLAQLMHEKDALFRNLQKLIRGAQILEIPILWCEQNPAGLGPTIPEVANLLSSQKPIPKMSFSSCGNSEFLQALSASARKQILLAGIEAHVCIYLTAADLLSAGYEVEVVADAVSSRSLENKQIALEKIRDLRVAITCTETALFELMRTADSPKFKELVKVLK